MSLSRNALNTLIAGAFAVSLAGTAGSAAFAQGDAAAKEKCYGVVKAGKNDCGAKDGSHSCAGHASLDGHGGEFVALPKGVCEKLVGGTLEPSDKQGAKPDAKEG